MIRQENGSPLSNQKESETKKTSLKKCAPGLITAINCNFCNLITIFDNYALYQHHQSNQTTSVNTTNFLGNILILPAKKNLQDNLRGAEDVNPAPPPPPPLLLALALNKNKEMKKLAKRNEGNQKTAANLKKIFARSRESTAESNCSSSSGSLDLESFLKGF